jgi:enamine deaminase RidA (YjgF/YER057c/UK114 family)
LTGDRLGGDGGGGVVRLGGDPPSPWEEPYGFSRVVRFPAGELVLVGGTTSVDVDGVVVGERPYEQTVEILRKIGHELERVGASLADVVQTRAYVVDISRADEVGRAHGEAFGGVGAGPGGGGGAAAGGGPAAGGGGGAAAGGGPGAGGGGAAAGGGPGAGGGGAAAGGGPGAGGGGAAAGGGPGAGGGPAASVGPAMTMVEVSALIDPRMLVEIEALAAVGG